MTRPNDQPGVKRGPFVKHQVIGDDNRANVRGGSRYPQGGQPHQRAAKETTSQGCPRRIWFFSLESEHAADDNEVGRQAKPFVAFNSNFPPAHHEPCTPAATCQTPSV